MLEAATGSRVHRDQELASEFTYHLIEAGGILPGSGRLPAHEFNLV